MSQSLRIVLAQLNLIVGDIQGNLDKLIGAAKSARDTLQADIIIYPELSLTGYPADDLLLRKSFIDASTDALYEFKQQIQGIYCLIGHPLATERGLFNACSLLYNDQILIQYNKQHLPNYGVFDERRYFTPGNQTCVIPILGIPVGIMICEDLWFEEPVKKAAAEGARLILSPNASPFEIDKSERRLLTLSKRAQESKIPILYVNYAGAQDDILFDGGSLAIDSTGTLRGRADYYAEKLFPVDIQFEKTGAKITASIAPEPEKAERIYNALVLGVRDYIEKNKFPGVLIGVSGGIDSALTLAIACDAIGKDRVKAIVMPSRFTSELSMEQALTIIQNAHVDHELISIEPSFSSFLTSLYPVFSKEVGTEMGLTQENLQARCRGVIIMAISNKTGYLVLSTGNRSEMAVGYSTLYGDMVGGLAVLKDIPKTLVYLLAEYRNTLGHFIPQQTIERAPTAELALNQKDEDSLPPYPILDAILDLYLNEQLSVSDIISKGFSEEVVTRIIQLVKRNEYKRYQAPIGLRINNYYFGRDRRYPITAGFLE